MSKNKSDAITWATVNNIVPIVTSAIMITISFMALSNKLELLNQKVEYLVKQTEEYNLRNKEVQTRLGIVESNIVEINTKLSINK